MTAARSSFRTPRVSWAAIEVVNSACRRSRALSAGGRDSSGHLRRSPSSSSRFHVGDLAASRADGACASACHWAVRDRRDAHLSRDVGHHVVETLARTRVGAHELSTLHVTVARWSVERMGPMIIAAPHRTGPRRASRRLGGHRGGLEPRCGRRRWYGEQGASERHAGHATGVCEQARLMRTKRRGRMCWTKRRRNAMAVSVIVRRSSSRA